MKKYTLIFITLFLNGCSPYKKGFNCEVPEGIPCTSMTRIHELIDEGTFVKNQLSNVSCKGCSRLSQTSASDQDWLEVVIIQKEKHADEPSFRKYVVSSQKSQ